MRLVKLQMQYLVTLTVTFDTAINSKIVVGNEVFGTNLTTNPTVSSIAK